MFEVPAEMDPSHRPKTRKQRKIPRSGTPATKKMVIGLVWILLFLQFSGWYNTELVLGDEYLKYGFLRRVWILEMLGFATRMKYYGVWYLTEGACILSGMGYRGVNPKTGQVDWNRLQNVNPWGIESAQNSRGYLENWNMNTNNWLRNYMYLRVTPKGKKPGFRASLATFVTSAFWHGFYPGYYLSFVLAAFLQTIAKSELPQTPQLLNIITFFLHPAVDQSWNFFYPRCVVLRCRLIRLLRSLLNPISRFSPPRPSVFPHSGRPATNVLQNLLRHPFLSCNTNSLLLHDRSIRASDPPRLPPRLGSRIFLHCTRRRSLNRILRVSRETTPNSETEAEEPTCHAAEREK